MAGIRRKFNPRNDPEGRRFPPHTKPPRQDGAVRTVFRTWRDGRKSQRVAAREIALRQEAYSMEMKTIPYDPAKSVASAEKQVTNTAGSGGVGGIVAGVIYGLLPESWDEQTRATVAGAVGILVTLGTSYAWGWWRNRQAHKDGTPVVIPE